MSWFTIATILLKVVNLIVNRINLTEGMRAQIGKELAALEVTIGKTKTIIGEKLTDAEVDAELRK